MQGVGFRWWTRARALELGLVGYASNQADGRVLCHDPLRTHLVSWPDYPVPGLAVARDLEVKGAGQTLKQGTVIRSIRLTDDPDELLQMQVLRTVTG